MGRGTTCGRSSKPDPSMSSGRARTVRREGVWHPRWFWPSFAVPGIVWLAVLFLVPFYVVLCVAFGTFDPIFRQPVPIWNPVQWYTGTFRQVLQELFGHGAFLGPAFIRTFAYVGVASLLCLVIGYPIAYYVARYGGKRKGLLLVLLI